MEHPRVFVSHASEDKERFVIDFATKLRTEYGVDAFVDEWEIYPGQSLVRRIFDEGIGQAEAVIVVISEHSINKPWVREELDVSTVRKIEDGIALIPVVIGEVQKDQIPMSLRGTVWQRISNLDGYDAELSRIVDAVYGRRERPPLGQQPDYTRADIAVVPGLRPADSQVLKLCCEMEMQRGERNASIDGENLIEEAEHVGLHREQVLKSVKLLAGRYLIEARSGLGTTIPRRVRITDDGFDEYAHTYIPGFESLMKAVGLEIVNHDADRSDELARSLDSPQVIVEHVLASFEDRGWLDIYQETLPWMDIANVSPELEYWLEGS
jgi:hypothetical protein